VRGGSPRALARVGAGVAALVAVVLSAAPALAGTGQIDKSATLPDGNLGVYFSAVGLAPGATLDLTTVTATVGGTKVPAKATFVKDAAAPLVRKTMLTIDISGSMKSPISAGSSTSRIEAAKTAAESYLAKVPSDVLVGLVTFESTTRVVVAPTTQHDTVLAAVKNLQASNGNTALYAGVIAANTALGTEDAKTQLNQLIISDGKNDDPTGPTESAAVTSIKKSGAQVDAVTIAPEPIGKQELTALTAAGGGTTVDANSSADLTAVFESAAATQQNQLLVDIAVPPEFAGTTQTVDISVSAGNDTFRDATAFALPGAVTAVPTDIAASYGPQPVDTSSGGIASNGWVLPVAVGAFAIGFFGLLAVAFLSSDRENQTSGRIRRRLSRYSLTSRAEPQPAVATSGALGQSQVARSAVELAGRVVQSRDLDTGLGSKLEAAGIPLKPAEWMIIHLGIAILAGLAMALLTGFGLLATLLGLAVGLIVPFLYLSLKEGRRKSVFASQLPETLQLLAGSLAAGYSLPQAVDTVVRESSGPMALELNRAIVEARLGVPIEDALETVARRMDSVDFEWVVMAIRIQREVGGNLAEVLTNVAATMRERERLRRQVDVLSAEGRLSAIILGALPLLFVVYLVLVRPEYIGLLITNPLGIVLIVVGVVLLIAGGFWLRKIVNVEV
jgi:tight adherence protein B